MRMQKCNHTHNESMTMIHLMPTFVTNKRLDVVNESTEAARSSSKGSSRGIMVQFFFLFRLSSLVVVCSVWRQRCLSRSSSETN